MELRGAEATDARGIAAVHVRAWQAAYSGLLPATVLDSLSVGQREAQWRQWLGERDASFTRVAEIEGRIAGFCSAATPSRDDDADMNTAEIAALYVAPDLWRRGVGRALLDAALIELRARGYQEATLWVLDGNTQGRAFYEALGWRADGAEKTHDDDGYKEVRLRTSLH